MKVKKIALTVLLGLCLCLAASGAALAMSSASYQLPWDVVSSGGGMKQSPNYLLGYTAGQPAAGISESTNYGLQSGYWHVASGVDYEQQPPVGGTIVPINKFGLVMPWVIAIVLVMVAGAWLGIWNRRREPVSRSNR